MEIGYVGRDVPKRRRDDVVWIGEVDKFETLACSSPSPESRPAPEVRKVKVIKKSNNAQ